MRLTRRTNCGFVDTVLGVQRFRPGNNVCSMIFPGRLCSRYFFCVMPFIAQGAHRGRPVVASPCPPGLRPAKSPLRGPFDLSLQASGRAEAASVQNTALSPHPCGLPRPSGNVSAILRPSAPAVSVAQVVKLITGRTNVGRVRRSRHPAKSWIPCLISCQAALRLRGPGDDQSRTSRPARLSAAVGSEA